MIANDSYAQRQDEELEVIRSIYVGEVADLRPKRSKWKTWHPMEIKIKLRPQESMTSHGSHAELQLRIDCGPKYPDVAPKFEVVKCNGLTQENQDDLVAQLDKLCKSREGEVMILDVCQFVQEFLVPYNRPAAPSIYDEMIENERKKLEERERLEKALKEKEEEEREKNRLELEREIKLKHEQLKEEARRRRANSIGQSDMRLSYSSDKNGDENEVPTCRGHKLTQVRVIIGGKERTLQRAKCIGHSSRGSIAFHAIDIQSAEMFALQEWVFSRKSSSNGTKDFTAHQSSLMEEVDSQFGTLCHVQHPNLVRYSGIVQEFQKERAIFSIVQEFLSCHTPLTMHVAKGVPLNLQVVRSYCQEILNAIGFLHDKGLFHGDLRLSNVFVNHQGTIKISDFGVVCNLYKIMESLRNDDPTFKPRSESFRLKFDVFSIGILTLSLAKGVEVHEESPQIPPSLPEDFQDFLRKCLLDNERWDLGQLLSHKFMTQKISRQFYLTTDLTDSSDLDETEPNSDEMSGSDRMPQSYDCLSKNSRLKSEFEILKFLGSGGFGSVIKVRNKLDSRIYAIKQIRLDPNNKGLNKRITREVMLLSRLNHENVVRYFNSWIEVAEKRRHTSSISEPSSSPKKQSLSSMLKREISLHFGPMRADSPDWSVSVSHVQDPSSDEDDAMELFGINPKSESSIQFEHSADSDSEDSTESLHQGDGDVAPKLNQLQYMFIQMEYCEKQTLRNAIDADLFKESDRLWRLFREIIEGLVHIHHQGMIHRDLKPVNIFLDSHDRAKIGDFGLATSALNAKPEDGVTSPDFQTESTGKVGTELYTAPESGRGVVYTQKVDIYSLGVIFFEMCYPCRTKMERAMNLANIRKPELLLPEDAEDYLSDHQIRLVRWLLQHDPAKRPTSTNLLNSDSLPPPVIEEAELNEMLRRTVSNPQSKIYKKLMNSLFNQQMSTTKEYAYDFQEIQNVDCSLKYSMYFGFVREHLESIMKLHGAQIIHVPLLTPKWQVYDENDDVASYMDNSGNIVCLPHETRIPFARFVAHRNVQFMKRYSIDRVYRGKKTFGSLPKELFEFSFDVISTQSSVVDTLPVAEVLLVLEDIFVRLNLKDNSRDFSLQLRVNHVGLVKALLIYSGINDEAKRRKVINLLKTSRNMSRLNFEHQLADLCVPSTCISMLAQFREVEESMVKVVGMYRSIVHNGGDAGATATKALEELELFFGVMESLKKPEGVTCLVVPCLVHDPTVYNSGVVFEVQRRLKKKSKICQDILAVGGCYDGLVNRFRVSRSRHELPVNYRAFGVSFSLDRLVRIAAESNRSTYVDAVLCSTASESMDAERAKLLNHLWDAGISSTVMSPQLSVEEVSQISRETNVNNLLLLKDTDPGFVKVRTFDKEKYGERRVAVKDAAETILTGKLEVQKDTPTRREDRSYTAESLIKVNIISLEKLSSVSKKRVENQVVSVLKSPLFRCVNDRLFVEVLAVDLNASQIRSLSISVNVESDERAFSASVREILDRLDNTAMRAYHAEICERIRELVFNSCQCGAFVLFSRKDSSFKIVCPAANCK